MDYTLAKKAAGEAAATLISDGMIVGLGTGTTAFYLIQALALRCQQGLQITAVATSRHSEELARQANIPIIDSNAVTYVDITVDGADEIDLKKNMIKGGGGALLREKILAVSSQEMVVIVDESKVVETLGKFPLPVEISPFAYRSTLVRLGKQGYQSVLRLNQNKTPFVTDNGHYIADLHFEQPILDPESEDTKLHQIVGVLETGLFVQIAGRVIIGYKDGSIKIQA